MATQKSIYAHMVHQSPDAISRMSIDGTFLMVNETVSAILGHPPEDIVGKTNRELGVPNKICEQFEQDLNWVVRHRQKNSAEFSYNGRHYEAVLVPELNEDQKIDSVLCFTRDITDREELQRYLREQLSFTRKMIGSIPVPILVLNSDLRLQFSNPAFLEKYQKKEEDIYEKFLFALLTFHDANLQELEASLKTLLEKSSAAELTQQVSLTMADKGIRHIRLHATRVDHLKSILLTLYDITPETTKVSGLKQDLQQRNQELTYSNEKLKSLLIELSTTEDRERRYLSDLLHDDVQQLLTGLGFKLKEIAEVAQTEDLEQQILKAQEVLTTIIQVTRELSHDLCPLEMHREDLKEAVFILTEQMKSLHGLSVDVHIENDSVLPEGDIRRILLKAVKEMLFNIAKHAEVQEATLYIQETGDQIEVMVQDHGKGFDAEEVLQRPQIMGMGLFTLKERLTSIGGNLEVESIPNEGSRFRLTVPTEINGPEPKPFHTLESGIGPMTSSQVRVVLVDDHTIIREALEKHLNSYPNMTVVGQAADGKEGVKVVEETKPDAVLMDIAMPTMSGAESTRIIKSRFPDTRVVGLSMFPREDLMDTLQHVGMDALLPKTALLSEVFEELVKKND